MTQETLTALWQCLWKTSAATAAVWLLTLLLRRQSAALRHGLWLCGLGAFILIPALLPLARRTPPVHLAVHVPHALDTLPVQFSVAAPATRSTPRKTLPVNRIILCTWLSGSLLLGIRRTRAAIRMGGIARRSRPSPNQPDVRISGEVSVPLTWGLFRPLILLPPCAVDWNPDCLRSVLEHEREHIRRFDPLAHWLAELVCAAWWFHPLAWLARSRAAHERECACDDAVLRSGVRPTDYASELLNLAATLPIKGEPIMALSALSDFERRIKNLLLPDIDRRPSSTGARVAVALATVALIVPLALLRAQAPAGQGDISGTVTDMSGARVPNAIVIATTSGDREVTRTNVVGEWSFSGIPAGDYTVEAKSPGFAISTRTITLAPGQRATLNHALSLGAVQETVNVVEQGQARRVESQSSEAPQRIRVGGNVQATKLLNHVQPLYPDTAKSQGIEGTVLLNAVIGKDGSLLSVKVMNKLADPDLAAAALDAVKQWRYQPTLLNGEPVEVITTITVNFTLQS